MINDKTKYAKNHEDERGAALIMALMITFLLMVGSVSLILMASSHTQNVTDAAAEQQAYNAAESGIQSAINVLRFRCTAAVSPCAIRPTPLLNPSLTDYNKANTMTFARALNLTTANSPGEATTAPRLSRWIGYDTAAPDRVKLGAPGTPYTVRSGNAYSLQILDPDNTGSNITFNTTGVLFDSDAGNPRKKTYGSGANKVVIEYTPKPVSNIVATGATPATTDLGSFTFTSFGVGASIPTLNRFEIVISMTIPYPATRIIRGFIEPRTTLPYTTAPKIIFDSQTYDLRGSDVVLIVKGAAMRQTGSQPYGYEATMGLPGSPNPNPNPNPSLTVVGATISATQPARLLIKSTGFGPRGARKELEAIIQNNYFDGLGAPATITMVGPPSTTIPATTFRFEPGNSNAMLYSGQDAAGGSTDILPPVGVTHPPNPITNDDLNLEAVEDALGGKLTNNVIGVPSNVGGELPTWLTSPAAMDSAAQALYNVARNSADATNPTGRYFPSGVQPTTWGDNATATGITFCDGNCTLGPIAGGGILFVTGTLTLHGNFSFNGLIVVTGQGGVIRSGGGNGTIQGNIVIAPYVNSPIAGNVAPALNAGFLAPQYSTSGGGASTITYNSNNQLNGLTAVSNVVLGVVEK